MCCAKVSQSITIDSPWVACAASVLAIANRRENSEAARGCPLQPAFPIGFSITSTTSHDPPRDTLNDEGTLLFFCLSHRSTKRLFNFILFWFTTPSPRTVTHRTCTPSRRGALPRTCVVLRDVSYQVWRTHMRACVAEYNFRGRVGRVRTGAPSRDDPARKKKVHVFVPWIPSDRFFLCFLAAFSRRFSSS